MSGPIDPDDTDLDATDLDSIVLAVQGVTEIYPARGMLAQLPALITGKFTGAVTRSATSTREPENVASVLEDGHVSITARIATSADFSASQTARRVADLLLSTTSDPSATIRIQVARIS